MPNGFSNQLLKKTLTGFGLWCCLFLIPTTVHSATTNSATLQWGANSESDLAGYKVYQGTTVGSYGLSSDVGKVTTYTSSNLQAGLTYYFAVTAYDTSGNESPPSIEVSKTPAGSVTSTAVTAWTAAEQNPGGSWKNSGFDNRSFRILLEGAAISTSGSTVQLTLRGRSSGTYTIQNISLVQRVGNTLNGEGALTPVTFNGGATSVTVPAGGTVTSDPITFNLTAGQDVFMTFWVPAGSPTVFLNGGTSKAAWTILGTDQTGARDWGGLAISATRRSIYVREVLEVIN